MPHKDPLIRCLYHRLYRERNKEKLRAYTMTAEFRSRNLERAKRYYKEHPDKVKANVQRARIKKRISQGKSPIGTRGPKTKSLAERFWSKVIKHEKGCWEWKGARHLGGYGKVGQRLASHVSWIVHFGSVPEGLEVCHSCDNPECTRPDHLWLGTHGDNMRDAFAKGRIVHIPKTHCKRGHEFIAKNTYVWGTGIARSADSCISGD